MPEVSFLASPKDIDRAFEKCCAGATNIWIATAWASNRCPSTDSLAAVVADPNKRIQALVVGTDFLQTDPAFLERFASIARISVEGDTFHPKVYLFRSGSTFRCLLGSSNFTAGGFASNVEANVLVEGSTSDDFFKNVKERIDRLNDAANLVTHAFVEDYRAKHATAHAALVSLRKYEPSRSVKEKWHAAAAKRTEANEERFVKELRRLPDGAAAAKHAERFLALLGEHAAVTESDEARNALFVRWNPQSFTISCAPLPGARIILAIAEKRAKGPARLDFKLDLMAEAILRETTDEGLSAAMRHMAAARIRECLSSLDPSTSRKTPSIAFAARGWEKATVDALIDIAQRLADENRSR